ncbi:MAG: circadian clock protein KaiA [Gloeocapsa sp. DLM2.Bin57]|nr:MAG: circadian clock protein KaiA [Gloeocapsa sp. DLM2.Bin57]
MSPRLSVCIYAPSVQFAQSLREVLSDQRYSLTFQETPVKLFDFVKANKEKIDCLVVVKDNELLPMFNQLYEDGTLLPVLIIDSDEKFNPSEQQKYPTHLYHSAEIALGVAKIPYIIPLIDNAIAQFLNLAPSSQISESPTQKYSVPIKEYNHSFLLLQQRRLAEKLKERLGYLGVYYNRNPRLFYRNLSLEEKEELIEMLAEEYRLIILSYFSDDQETNNLIDLFVNRAFFADISVSKVLEIHMKLMDEFAQQLKLEGRNEEILLDYRLALIDIIAHLCEMYRRSIPREDLPFEL